MAYKTILVHLDDIRRADRLLEVALPLADKMDAHVIAFNIMPPHVIITGGDMGVGAVVVDDHREAYRSEAARLKERFTTATKYRPAKSEWRQIDAGFNSATQVIIEHSHVCDLIVVNQKDPDWALSQFLEEPERIAVETGRPVLLVPNKGKLVMPPKRVTIAWNGRREAVRAVFDALPLLIGTDEVNIIWISPEQDQPNAGDLPGAELGTILSRHGIKCTVSQSTVVDISVASELLRQSHAFGSDVLVMGAYGHSRLREFVLGGASRDILLHMDLPVLMSH